MIARRYLVLFSPVEKEAALAAEQASASCGLTIVHHTERMVFLTEERSACVPLESGEGAFVGTLFSTSAGHERLSTISHGKSHAIMMSDGQAALKDFWGGYVLATENRYGDAISVSRDPSGAMPCYMATIGTLTAFASEPRTLAAAGVLQPLVDYPALLRHLAFPDVCLPETCLTGLVELLPGTRFEWGGGSARTVPWWSPWTFTSDPVSVSFAEAPDRLRATIDGCVKAWASCCSGALVTLSGGLDSSIVTSALSRSGISLTALNMVGESAAGDERAYARLVCRHLDIPLAEAPFDVERVDLRLTSAVNRARPVGVPHMQPLEAAIRRNARTAQADALFNGMAGDSILCSMKSALPVADAILARRSVGQVWRTARDVAAIADVNIVAVARQAVRMVMRGRRSLHASGTAALLSVTGKEAMAPHSLPAWLRPDPDTLPGRAYHVEMIARLQCFVEGLDRWNAPPTIVPLLSQPVMELCLRIPSWYWVAGGQNRAVAREAYRHRLPEAITGRRSKGGPGAMGVSLCLDNLPLLRAILLEGNLARQGLLDGPSLERALSHEALLQRDGHFDILSLVEAEAWITYWTQAGSGSWGGEGGTGR